MSEADRMVLLFPLLPLRGEVGGLRRKKEVGRKTSQSQHGEQRGERMVTDSGSCQKTSDALHCPGGEETSLPKSRRPNMIAKATPVGPQTANTAAEPVRHLGKLPEFLDTSM